MKHILKNFLHTIGYDVIKYRPSPVKKKDHTLADFTPEDWELVEYIKKYTRTTPERIYALKQAVEYIVKSNIPGDIVECGVWRGGNIMAIARLLRQHKDLSREIYLYDTFEGMSEPTEKDVAYSGEQAADLLNQSEKEDEASVWCYAGLEEVQENMKITQYPYEKFHFIQGKVEDTIPAKVPESIALLRLDTDWYESTRHELVYLFPRLVKGGVVIIDDYGHWEGARVATDEYFEENNIKILLNRIDYTGRMAVKI